jgi:hypothetical protein
MNGLSPEVIAKIISFMPLILPLVLIELVLIIVALTDLVRREKTRGPKWMWAIIIVFGEMLGPILYFIFGRIE